MKLKQFIEQSHIDASLIRSVVRQSGGWASFVEDASDIVNHGADGGFNGFIYYTDTCPFAKHNAKAIMDLCDDFARDIGTDRYSMIAGFNCLRLSQSDVIEALHDRYSDYKTMVLNALAWFALEEVARSFVDLAD